MLPAMDSRPGSITGIASTPRQFRSRAPSSSSDRPSTVSHGGLMSPPLTVSPEAAFIAASAASQIVTNDHDSHADTWYDQHGIEPSGETALVSHAALQLVNNFLDQLLFNFLLAARSTTLANLRPAVSEVLKPKLAKDAINNAEEELREYLGGADDADNMTQSQAPHSFRDWDLELVWKRTRLRCMVYSSLGDMEEEDEDFYMEQENLDIMDGTPAETVSPAVAIFLTSILEFMGEQALIVAGQAAYHRMRVKYEKDMKEGLRSPMDIAERIVVEDLDMERVALDRTLGRLWRAWKKKIRSPGLSIDHTARVFPADFSRGTHTRHGSLQVETSVPKTVSEEVTAPSADDEPQSPRGTPAARFDTEPQEMYEPAARVPLPIGEYDIAEIEYPGLATYSDDEHDPDGMERTNDDSRPKSLMIFAHSPFAGNGLPTPTLSQPHTPVISSRKRSNSLPTPAGSPHASPSNRATALLVAAKRTGEGDTSGTRKTGNEGGLSISRTRTKPAEARGFGGQKVSAQGSKEGPASEPAATAAKGAVSNIISSAAAVGAAAAAGVAAMVQGSAVQTDAVKDTKEDSDSEMDEEPQIMTSSRISISGRSSSTHSDVARRPSPINTSLPMRTPSVHSARLIEVTGPKSPIKSRNSSIDALDRVSLTGTLSRTSSFSASIVEGKRLNTEPSPVLRSATTNSLGKAAPERALRPSRTNTSEGTISEADEPVTVDDRSPITSTRKPVASIRQTAHSRVHAASQDHEVPEPIFGSADRPAVPPPGSPIRPTKVTLLSSSAVQPGRSSSDEHECPEAPRKSPVQPRTQAPLLPERSANRQLNGSSTPISATGVTPNDWPSSKKGYKDRTRDDATAADRPQDQTTAGRSIHTSDSSSSSQLSGGNRLKGVPSSEDTAPQPAQYVTRSFEELIRSDETIQYTLTPEGMRDVDSTRSFSSSSPIMPPKGRNSSDSRARSGSVSRSIDREGSISVSRSAGLGSHPTRDGPVPKAPPAIPGASRSSGPQAREARVPRESVNDFAEFIRSTGPAGGEPDVRANGPARSTHGPPSVAKASLESNRLYSSHRPRLQARDATIGSTDDSTDLIDFIRRGPPTTNPRIPRTVAPFRSTMDSDQLQAAMGGKPVEASVPDTRYSQASTNVTESSINSQSALINQNQARPPQSTSAFTDEDMMMPKRKTRRVRDPYAIDFSDEEDDEDLFDTPKRPQESQEESLADFLRNVPPPPPEPTPPPISAAQNRPKKKASAPSLITRLGNRMNSMSGNSQSSGSLPSPKGDGQESRSLNSRAGTAHGSRGYVPIQVNVPAGSDHTRADLVPPIMAPRTSASGRVPMKRFEPREASSTRTTRTSDLAEFLLNSEPPPSAGPSFAPVPEQPEHNGFSKVFSRRKKHPVP